MSGEARVLLCADIHQREMLEAVGALDLSEHSWLIVREGAREAREALASFAPEEAWVFSSDEVEGINLAAALKADDPRCRVYLAGCPESGSMRSRLQAADLDGALTAEDVTARIRERSQAAAGADGATSVADPLSGNAANGARSSGFLLTVVSGSGGAGKSTVSTVLVHLGSLRGLSVALVDADLQFGDLREMGGAAACLSLDELAAGSAQFPAERCEGVLLLHAPHRLELSEVLADRLGDMVDAALARFDLVVVNTGGNWSEQHVRLIERSAATVFLVDQRASSVRSCRHALDLCVRCGIATGSFLLALNRCTRRAPFTSIDVSSALQGAHVAELADGGGEVEELLGSGMASQLVSTGNELCLSADRLLDELLPAHVARGEAPSARPGVIARFGARGSRARGGRGRRGGERLRPSAAPSRAVSSIAGR